MNAHATAESLGPWVAEVTGDPGPFSVRQLAGGNSNQTLAIQSPSPVRVVRRPPAAAIDQIAHSIEREHRVLSALAGTGVPVPRAIDFDAEPGPGGPPALLMEHLDGVSITAELPAGYGTGATEAVAFAAVDALADLHAVDWRCLGLETLGRPRGFLERQVGRWRRQYSAYAPRELADFEPVAAWLEDHRPPDGDPGLLHGDFHVDNCLFSRAEPVRLLGIIDWEMATIGDPLLDVGLLLALWGTDRAAPYAMPAIQGFSRAPDAPGRGALACRYEKRSGRSLEHITYYMTLALFKLAAIVEGAYAQNLAGRLDTPYARALEHDVPRLLAAARTFTEGSFG
jgi:aminoglycoside phosphotransferase (APT) family kinase protein